MTTYVTKELHMVKVMCMVCNMVPRASSNTLTKNNNNTEQYAAGQSWGVICWCLPSALPVSGQHVLSYRERAGKLTLLYANMGKWGASTRQEVRPSACTTPYDTDEMC